VNYSDQISLTGLRCTGFHGVLEHERREGQVFIVDLTLNLPLAEAAESDDLTKTVSYADLAERVVAAVENDPVDLIETLAQRIADIALSYDRVVFVQVTVHKPNAPIDAAFDDVSVTLARRRP
jgi:dihydroneopterin aldolase